MTFSNRISHVPTSVLPALVIVMMFFGTVALVKYSDRNSAMETTVVWGTLDAPDSPAGLGNAIGGAAIGKTAGIGSGVGWFFGGLLESTKTRMGFTLTDGTRVTAFIPRDTAKALRTGDTVRLEKCVRIFKGEQQEPTYWYAAR